MMMHDEGTVIYDMMAQFIADNALAIVLAACAIAAVVIVLAFLSEMIAALAARDREQVLRDQNAILDLKHRGQWPTA